MTPNQTSGPVILLGGPTASGKSGLALRLAEAIGGELINADSMQVYDDLQILTARPEAGDLERCPHHLFGHMDAAQRCSVGHWHEEARAAAHAVLARGNVPILVGGTGFYLNAFRFGMSPIPDVPEAIRVAYTHRMETEGSAVLHGELAERDPNLAAELAPGDSQRIQRGLEVLKATGRPLSHWQAQPREGGWRGPLLYIILMPPRQALYDLCDVRFDAMMTNGAYEEVRRLAARNLDHSLPAMRALGVTELLAAEAGAMEMEDAVARAKMGTRRYAKRQSTWFRNQVSDSRQIAAFGFDPAAESAFEAVNQFLLTHKASPA